MPDVFDNGWVNGSIWTVPYEIACYAVISVLIYYKLLTKRWIVVGLSVLMLAIQVGLALAGHDGPGQVAHTLAGDYSYGIYLYGWPFTQATPFMFPQYAHDWVFLFVVSLGPILLFAAAFWHLVERPILQLRPKFSFVARQRLAEEAADADAAPAGVSSLQANVVPERS
ncbi:MAG: hypothetical protein V4579_00660 [Pseudomonadota bacterium]